MKYNQTSAVLPSVYHCAHHAVALDTKSLAPEAHIQGNEHGKQIFETPLKGTKIFVLWAQRKFIFTPKGCQFKNNYYTLHILSLMSHG